jgi:DNA-binding beta-propeller fold protein YncE
VTVAALTAFVAVPAAQASEHASEHESWLQEASPQKVVKKLVPNPAPQYRTDVYNLARKLAKKGPDGTVDVTTLVPQLPSFLDWTGCSTTKIGIICWGEAMEPVVAGVFDVCSDGRTIYQNSQTDHIYTRLYGFDHKLILRDQSWRSPYFKLSFSADAKSGIVINDTSWYDVILTMDTPGVLAGISTWSGVVDYAVSSKGNVVVADYGMRQEDWDGNTVSGYQAGVWPFWDDYDATKQRLCDALDGKL